MVKVVKHLYSCENYLVLYTIRLNVQSEMISSQARISTSSDDSSDNIPISCIGIICGKNIYIKVKVFGL